MNNQSLNRLRDLYFDKDWYLYLTESLSEHNLLHVALEPDDEAANLEYPSWEDIELVDMPKVFLFDYCGDFVILSQEALKYKHPSRLLPIIIDLISAFNFLEEYENCQTYDDSDSLMEEIFILGRDELTPGFIRSFYKKNWYLGGFFGEYVNDFMNGKKMTNLSCGAVQDVQWMLNKLYGEGIDFDDLYTSTDVVETIYKAIYPYNLMHENLTFMQRDYDIIDINEEKTESPRSD